MRAAFKVTLLCCAVVGLAHAVESRKATNIPAQALRPALQLFSKERDVQVVFRTDIVAEMRTNGASGELTVDEALRQLLRGTPLTFEYVDEKTVTIVPIAREEKIAAAVRGIDSMRVAQSQEAAVENPTASDSESQSMTLEEIVVTAQKRKSTVQDTPLSVTALGSEEIEQRGLVGMSDYLRTLPGVNEIDRGAGRNAIIMRGIAASPQSEGADIGPTVGVYLGDIPLTGYTNTGGSTDIKLIDMARVEVLRGPQGTLFGDSSMGGTVRNIPQSPDLQKVSGDVSLTYSNTEKNGDHNTAAQGFINLPIIEDKLAVRVVGYSFDYGGFVDNIAADTPSVVGAAAAFGAGDLAVNEKSANDERYRGGRLALLWQPQDSFSAKLTYLHQDMDLNGLPEVQLNLPGKYEQARLRLGAVAGGGEEGLQDSVDVVNLELEKTLGWASLTSSTSYIEEETDENRDLAIFLGGIPFPQLINFNADVFVQELRLASQLQGPLQFLVGLYYQDMDQDLQSDTFYGGDPSLNPFGNDSLYLGYGQLTNLKQKAIFGEVSYDIAQKFKLSLGGRLFDYERTTEQVRSEGFSAGQFAAPLRADETGAIYRVNGSYRPDNRSLLYVQWSEGFRLGRAVPPIPINTCDGNNDGLIDGSDISTGVRQIDADTLDSYEFGAKTAMLDRRVVLNAAVYRNEWKGLPIGRSFTCGATALVNAGTARTQGLEIESEFLLTEALRLSLGGSYVDAKLTSDAAGLGEAGDRLPGSPKFNMSSSLSYSFNVSGNHAFVRGDYAYVGKYFNNLQATGIKLGDYHQLNLRGGINLHHIDLELFANNVTNVSSLTWTDTVFGGLDDRAVRLRPRTIGIKLGYSF